VHPLGTIVKILKKCTFREGVHLEREILYDLYILGTKQEYAFRES